MKREEIARGTLAALQHGQYLAPDGAIVAIAAEQARCVAGTRLYDPDALMALQEAVLRQPATQPIMTIAVVNATTLETTAKLAATGSYQRIGVLNFASAKNPGGGFLNGAQAQEESLARSSGLYQSLLTAPDFYAFHRAQDTCLYSDHSICSPGCPVFRDDAGGWLPRPYSVDMITCAAPNAGVVMRNEPEHRQAITPTLRQRAGKVLALAASQTCDALVLGAWGCGVFQNIPEDVARVFGEWLLPGMPFAGRFAHVIFAIATSGRTAGTYLAFAERFARAT